MYMYFAGLKLMIYTHNGGMCVKFQLELNLWTVGNDFIFNSVAGIMTIFIELHFESPYMDFSWIWILRLVG